MSFVTTGKKLKDFELSGAPLELQVFKGLKPGTYTILMAGGKGFDVGVECSSFHGTQDATFDTELGLLTIPLETAEQVRCLFRLDPIIRPFPPIE